MVRSQCLKPINKILWVVKSGVETIDAEQICIERVGEKAFGLASLRLQSGHCRSLLFQMSSLTTTQKLGLRTIS